MVDGNVTGVESGPSAALLRSGGPCFLCGIWLVTALNLRSARVSGNLLSPCLAYVFGRFWSLIPPKIFEPAGRKLRIPYRMLNAPVPEIRLQRAGIDAIVRELETA